MEWCYVEDPKCSASVLSSVPGSTREWMRCDTTRTCEVCPPNSEIMNQIGPVNNACACSENYYADITGTAMTCIKCDDDKTAPAGSSICNCKKDLYYQNETKDQNDNVICINCPFGANCSRHGMQLEELSALPGHWRPTKDSRFFPECNIPENCCPDGCSHLNVSSSRTDDQCKIGHTSALCMACADDYVTINGACVPCKGGGFFSSALIPMFSSCFLLFLIVLGFIVRGKKLTAAQYARGRKLKRMNTKNSALAIIRKHNKMFGQMKILLSLFQIISSMPSIITGVEFSPFFRDIANIFGVFNLDILSFSGFVSCHMSVRFFDQFLIHMMLPIGCFLAILSAFVVAHKCTSTTNTKKHTQINEAVSKMLILVILLLFPGLSTKIFQVWKCTSVDGIDDVQFLVQDYNIKCYQGEHITFLIVAAGFLLLYIVGIPLTMLVLMFRNRKHLHDVDSPKHHATKNALGGLYGQCK